MIAEADTHTEGWRASSHSTPDVVVLGLADDLTHHSGGRNPTARAEQASGTFAIEKRAEAETLLHWSAPQSATNDLGPLRWGPAALPPKTVERAQ